MIHFFSLFLSLTTFFPIIVRYYATKKNHTAHLITKARIEFLKDFIDRNSLNQKNLFLATKRLLKEYHEVPFPPFKDKMTLANQMRSFFTEKIKAIHSKLDGLSSSLPVISNNNDKSWSGTWMDQFKRLCECEVRRLIEGSAEKTCILDPMPTSLVIGCTQVLLPVLTKIINLSLESGRVADNWKCALVNPLLKKSGLDLVFKNCRPVSNLQTSMYRNLLKWWQMVSILCSNLPSGRVIAQKRLLLGL